VSAVSPVDPAFPAPVVRADADELLVVVPQRGIEPAWLARPLADLGLECEPACRVVRVEAPREWHWTTRDAAFLARLLTKARAPIELHGVPPELEKLLRMACAAPLHAPDPARRAGPRERVGAAVLHLAAQARGFVALLGAVVLLLPRFVAGRARIRGAELVEVLAESGSRALPIVAVTNLLMGAILAFVGAVQLRTFGAGIYVANLVGIASVRELTPILTAIVLAGRTGASFAARIATMQGNEEIDALSVLNVQAAEFLALPRVVALALLMPLLFVYGAAAALVGGGAVAVVLLDMSAVAYATQTQLAVGGADFAIGALKSLVFGGLVAFLGCHHGLAAPRSAAGVGAATTSAVVSSIFGIIALDAVFALCANALNV
jgi:phospholipid/cholesterol/gamma-HCH transport system permease protein